MNKKKILVTGADGFIGSHLVECLVKKGYAVKAFVLYNSFNSWGWLDTIDKSLLTEIEIFQGDVRDPFGVKKAMTDCNKVLHLAALIGIPYSYHSPQNYVETNIQGTLNIVQAAKELNLEKVIHTSTSEVYGTAQYVPIDEKHPLQPQSPYSASKIAADQMALSYYYAFQLPVSIIRPFNTFGPRQSARAVIPTIITQIANGSKTIDLGSLTPTRDFTYVDDTAEAFAKALEANEIVGKTINLGTNFEISIGDLVKEIASLMNTDINITCDEQRLRPSKSEVERLLSNNMMAKELLGWEPKHQALAGLRTGLQKTIEWFLHKDNQAMYKAGIYNI
ncbi:MAG TPA: NAD-dependent 4,6-dehydratase LegB [Candidatus Berkiella sp.]|nr:NAD-dependent 4,6-dehydratase LegB [Candidatus Berkiella sp.]